MEGRFGEISSHLVSFVPRAVLDFCSHFESGRFIPHFDRFHGVLLFADISGFTSLNEKMAERGYYGLEKVAHHLNKYFGDLIDILHQNGGDLYKIAGDACIAVFGSWRENISLEELCLRAVQCAIKIQTSPLRSYNKDGISLSLHIGIGCSDVYGFHVGGIDGCLEYIIAGHAFSQLESAVSESMHGEIVVSPNVWDYVQKNCKGVRTESNWRIESMDSLNDFHFKLDGLSGFLWKVQPCISSYIQPAVVERIKAGQMLYLGEFRKVTVLFIGLNNLSFVTPSNDLLQTAVIILQRILFKYEGLLRQFIIDDKGSVCIGVFGAPISHEDDPLRAVRAAIDIQEELKEAGFDATIGVTTGKVYCGAVGNKKRQEYAVVGDTVNLAARLMKAVECIECSSRILCDFATYGKTKKDVTYHCHDPVKVKGKKDPVNVFSPSFVHTEKKIMENHIVGREKERECIIKALEKIKAKSGSILLVESRAGLGKSALLHFACDEASKMNVKAFKCFADSIDRYSYLPWKNFFMSLLGVKNAEDNRFLIRLISFIFLEKIQKYSKDHLCLLNPVFPLQLEESGLFKSMTPQSRQTTLVEMLVDLLQMIVDRGRPICLCVEDCQWLDTVSGYLLVQFVTRVKPLLCLLTTRPEVRELSWFSRLNEEKIQTLFLGPMSELEGRELVCKELKVDDVSDSLWETLSSSWNGNPFVLQEIVILNSGAFCVENNIGLLSENGIQLNIPDSVEGIITSRIDSFDPTAQLILKVGSIIGHSFSIQTLMEVFPIKESITYLTEHLLKIVISGDILSVHGQTETFQFVHHTIREVIYNLLLISQRVKLHKLVAKYWELHKPNDWPVVAHHWAIVAFAEEPPVPKTVKKAIHCLLRSATVSQENGLYTEALGKCKMALDLTQKLPQNDIDKEQWENRIYFNLAQTTQLNEDSSGAVEFYSKAKLPTLSTSNNQTFYFKKRKRMEPLDSGSSGDLSRVLNMKLNTLK